MTVCIVDRRLFTDGLERDASEDAEGRQYAHGDDGRRRPLSGRGREHPWACRARLDAADAILGVPAALSAPLQDYFTRPALMAALHDQTLNGRMTKRHGDKDQPQARVPRARGDPRLADLAVARLDRQGFL
jgi:hypothetical protein